MRLHATNDENEVAQVSNLRHTLFSEEDESGRPLLPFPHSPIPPHLAMEMIADTHKLLALEVVEVNPVLDTRNRTAELAAGLILSAFGQRIL